MSNYIPHVTVYFDDQDPPFINNYQQKQKLVHEKIEFYKALKPNI